MGFVILVLFLFALYAEDVLAQGLLPKGVGLYQLGYRAIPEIDNKFDENGLVIPLGDAFNRRFVGPAMLDGRQGKDLQKLSQVLRDFEGGDTGPDSLTGKLDLGHLHSNVRAVVNSTIIGLGFGLSKDWTLFAGIPFISARVDTELEVLGSNNALATLDQVGSAAFGDLKDGLIKASELNTAKVKSNFHDFGYKPVEKWAHSGVGDARIGLKTAFQQKLSKQNSLQFGLLGRVDIPSGYVERADTLTDISFGKGYYSLTLGGDQTFQSEHFLFGVDQAVSYNFQAKMQKRVPEGEETSMAADRTSEVTINPGDDIDAGIFAGGKWGWLAPRYRFAVMRHFADKWEGPLDGNYDALSNGSDSRKLYHEFSLTLDTSKAYREGQFAVPLILAVKGHRSLQGRNTSEQNFFEISVASFFSTGLADRP